MIEHMAMAQNNQVESRIEKIKRASSLLAETELKGKYSGMKALENRDG